MFFLFFQLCAAITLIPTVFSLYITLESNPEAFKIMLISLRWAQNDPVEFVLGAFTINGNDAVSENQVVKNFTADRSVDMTFNISSSEEDCILSAYLSPTVPRNAFAQSSPFTVISISAASTRVESVTRRPLFSSTSTTSGSTTSSPTPNYPSTNLGTAPSVPPGPASHTGVIVGSVLGLLALGCMVSASIYVFRSRWRPKIGNLPLLCPQDSPAPPTPFLLGKSSQRETGAQENAPAASREHLEVEIATMREEIRALQLDNQIRRMEAGYECPPPYRPVSSSSRSTFFDT